MTGERANIHACALVLGTTGFLVLGDAGSGKSTLTLQLLQDARRAGLFARIVADDRVVLDCSRARPVAAPAPELAGLVECRGSGVLPLPALRSAVVHYAIMPASAVGIDRVPRDGETVSPCPQAQLPVVRLRYASPASALAVLELRLGRL